MNMKSTKRKFREDWLLLCFVAFIALVMAIMLYSAFWPYRPYKLYDYSINPRTVCPGEVVQVQLTRKLDKGAYDLTVDAEWYEVGTDKFLELADGDYRAYGTGKRETTVSPLLRVTPNKPGRWVFKAAVLVNGRVGVLPRTQRVTENGDGPITVLEKDDKRC
jgi:hypothetical protein